MEGCFLRYRARTTAQLERQKLNKLLKLPYRPEAALWFQDSVCHGQHSLQGKDSLLQEENLHIQTDEADHYIGHGRLLPQDSPKQGTEAKSVLF